METNRNLLQLLDPAGNSRVYRSRRELARDEQTYYERFYSADANDTAVKNTVASIASSAALLLAKIRPRSHGARSLPGGP
jgi:hypothetical protein